MDRTRRRYLKTSAYIILTSGLLGCQREERPATSTRTDSNTSSAAATPPQPPSEVRCDDTKGLVPTEIQHRKELKYTDRSPNSNQTCGNCMHLQPVPGSDGPCKRCSVLAGPVHVSGWCSAWVARLSNAG